MKHLYNINIQPLLVWLITGVLLSLPVNAVMAQALTVNTGELHIMPGAQLSVLGPIDNQAGASFINDGEAFIYSYFNNDGEVDYTSGEAGYTRFEGTPPQLVTGSNPLYFYDVLFNNGSNSLGGIGVAGTISIAGEANFLNGIVNNDDYGGTITFERYATHINTSTISNVDGAVEKLGDTEFLYPIGDASQLYRPAGISAPEDEMHLFTATYFFESTDTNYPINSINGNDLSLIDHAEYWLIERTVGDSEVMITLSWDSDTTPDEITGSPIELLRIARWDDTSQHWVDQGGVADDTEQTISTVVDGYGIFTLAVATDNLPCEYVEVQNLITPNNDGINDAFEIQLADATCIDIDQIQVKIYNRWGVKVFETNDYYSGNKIFDGFSDGRSTMGKGQLPSGTYFYILTYNRMESGNSKTSTKSGYLYINGN